MKSIYNKLWGDCMRKKTNGCLFYFLIFFAFICLALTLISTVLFSIAFLVFIYLIIKLVIWIFKKVRNKNRNNRNTKNHYSERTKNTKRKMNYYQIEQYARECNAYLEHEDEMEEYMKHYNLQDSSEPDSNY